MIDIYNKRITVQWVCNLAFFTIALINLATHIMYDVEPGILPFYYAANIVVLIVAIPLLINTKIKASLAAAIMSIAYGIYCVLQNYEIIASEGLEGFYYYECLLLLILGAVIILFGVGLLFKYNYNSKRLQITTIISLVVIAIPILLSIRTGVEWNALLVRLIQDGVLSSTIFLSLLLLVLNSPEIKFYSAYNRLSKNIVYIREVFSVAKDTWIYRNDFRRLVNYENEEWTPVGGPIKEEQIYIIHIYKATLRLMIQRWDDGAVRLKIAQNRTGVIMDKINMQLTEIIPDGDVENCESFTIFGTEGMFIRLLVKDDKDTKKSKKVAAKMMKDIDPEFETGEE